MSGLGWLQGLEAFGGFPEKVLEDWPWLVKTQGREKVLRAEKP